MLRLGNFSVYITQILRDQERRTDIENSVILQYSVDLKSDHLKSGNILNPETFEGWISICYSYSPNHLKTRPFKIRSFCLDFR